MPSRRPEAPVRLASEKRVRRLGSAYDNEESPMTDDQEVRRPGSMSQGLSSINDESGILQWHARVTTFAVCTIAIFVAASICRHW
jgi:hypothetical protein